MSLLRDWAGRLLNSVIRSYDSLSQPRLLTTNATQSEVATIEGDRFHSLKCFSSLDTATPLYVLFENPIESGVLVALQKRQLKTYSSGLESFVVLWDYDVSTATKTQMPVFNENNAYRGVKDSQIEISTLNSVTTPSTGDWDIQGAATIVDEGIERECDFIVTNGQGSNSSGDVSPDLGFRFYKPGTGFLAKIVSDSNSNKVIFGYDWVEVPLGIL